MTEHSDKAKAGASGKVEGYVQATGLTGTRETETEGVLGLIPDTPPCPDCGIEWGLLMIQITPGGTTLYHGECGDDDCRHKAWHSDSKKQAVEKYRSACT